MNIIKKIIGLIMDSLETVVFIGSIYIVVYIFLFMPTQVRGASMEPTLHNGDRLIISKITYKFRPLTRGDIVVINAPRNPDVEYIKRIIGLPGDVILIKKGAVYVNNVLLPDYFTVDKTNVGQGEFLEEDFSFNVPKGDVFVMGDNRPHSFDSREFGPIPITSIVGEVSFRYFPTDKFGWLKNPLPQNLQ